MRTNSMAPPASSPIFAGANALKSIVGRSSLSAPSIINSIDEQQQQQPNATSSTAFSENSMATTTNHHAPVANFCHGIFNEEMMALGLGDAVQCTMRSGELMTGEIMRIDERVWIMREPQRPGKPMPSLHFVDTTSIKSFRKLASTSPRKNHCYAMQNLPFTSRRTAEERVAKAEFYKNELWIDDDQINEQGCRTFIELKRIFDDVIWDGSDILILRCVRVQHPYDETAIKPIDSRSSSLNTLARIQKILQRHGRSRSPTTSSSAASISERLDHCSIAAADSSSTVQKE